MLRFALCAVALSFVAPIAHSGPAHAQEQQDLAAAQARESVRVVVDQLGSKTSVILVGATPKRLVGDIYPMLGEAGYRLEDERQEQLVFVPCNGGPIDVIPEELESVSERCSDRDEKPILVLFQYGKFSVAIDTPLFANGKNWSGAVVNFEAGEIMAGWSQADAAKWTKAAIEGAVALGDASAVGADSFVVEAVFSGTGNFLKVKPVQNAAALHDWAAFMPSTEVLMIDR